MKKTNILHIYLPESRARRKLRAFAFRHQRTLWQERQIHRTDLSQLIQSVLFWFLLLFSFRIGTIIFFALSGHSNYYGLPVYLPSAQTKSWFSTNKQTIQIWINKEGLIAFEDKIVDLRKLEEIFLKKRRDKLASRAFLYVDKACRMELVQQVIDLARECGFNKLIFSTRAAS